MVEVAFVAWSVVWKAKVVVACVPWNVVANKVVEVALVVVPFPVTTKLVEVPVTMTRLVIVDDAALTRIPPVKERSVEVAFPGNGCCPREALVMYPASLVM